MADTVRLYGRMKHRVMDENECIQAETFVYTDYNLDTGEAIADGIQVFNREDLCELNERAVVFWDGKARNTKGQKQWTKGIIVKYCQGDRSKVFRFIKCRFPEAIEMKIL